MTQSCPWIDARHGLRVGQHLHDLRESSSSLGERHRRRFPGARVRILKAHRTVRLAIAESQGIVLHTELVYHYPDQKENNESSHPSPESNITPAGNFDDAIASHAASRGHWPGKTPEKIKQMIEDVRKGWDNKYTTPNQETIYRKGDVILIENPARGEGTIFQPSRDALE